MQARLVALDALRGDDFRPAALARLRLREAGQQQCRRSGDQDRGQYWAEHGGLLSLSGAMMAAFAWHGLTQVNWR
jgi:hypothetical protein